MSTEWGKLWGIVVLSGLSLLVLQSDLRAAPGVVSDQEDDKKKADREWREAEGGQKKGGQAPGEGGAGPGGALQDNPLEKILELMRGVEDRLFQSDTGDFTQDEQKKIVEAMRFEDKTSQALEELIRKIEEEMQKQQSSSSSSSSDQQEQQQQKRQQQQQNETEQQRREREQREQEERRREEQRKMQEQQRQQQQNQQRQPQQDRTQRDQQERREGQPPPDQQSEEERQRQGAGRWGQLPNKLFQDAQNAQNQPPPERWRALIERFRTRMSDGGDED
jgi:hypothetical protein